MMKKIAILIAFLWLGSGDVFSQSLNLIERFNLDTLTMFNMIRSSFNNECNKPLSGRNDIRIYPFYLFVDTCKHSKGDYTDFSFLEKLVPVYLDIPKWHPSSKNTDTTAQVLDMRGFIVADTSGCPLGIGGAPIDPCCYQNCINSNTVYSKLGMLHLLHENKMDIIFRTCSGWHSRNYSDYFFGINYAARELFVIVDTRYGTEVFAIEDILEHHWEDFQDGLPKLYKEVRQRKMIEYENEENNFKPINQ